MKTKFDGMKNKMKNSVNYFFKLIKVGFLKVPEENSLGRVLLEPENHLKRMKMKELFI